MKRPAPRPDKVLPAASFVGRKGKSGADPRPQHQQSLIVAAVFELHYVFSNVFFAGINCCLHDEVWVDRLQLLLFLSLLLLLLLVLLLSLLLQPLLPPVSLVQGWTSHCWHAMFNFLLFQLTSCAQFSPVLSLHMYVKVHVDVCLCRYVCARLYVCL